eukprot:CAMPEP_0182603192 /NCGR_PEP_ID=MMETSP1324-20130603/92370_1 /TAXON_ID=236786 /ORGANISM="Florenciella sp., Strain RCC1587" /LENGTH=956 /DNA_ID=CAMNT_0024821119 /DNA_START=44 /DNA_END=2914 /DNA_ORIENTATION=-
MSTGSVQPLESVSAPEPRKKSIRVTDREGLSGRLFSGNKQMVRANSINKGELFKDERAQRKSIANILNSMDKTGSGQIDVSEIVDLVQEQRKVQLEKSRFTTLDNTCRPPRLSDGTLLYLAATVPTEQLSTMSMKNAKLAPLGETPESSSIVITDKEGLSGRKMVDNDHLARGSFNEKQGKPSMRRQSSVSTEALFEDERAQRKSIANILNGMDKTGSGEIDVSEIVDLVQEQRKVELEKKRIVMLAVALFLFLALSLGGNYALISQAQKRTAEEIEKLPHADSDDDGDTSVALVTDDGKAVSTGDIESYAALLDLPLLGTAELNKIDGITFQTYKGIQHYKITGYTLSTEVDSNNVEVPHLSMMAAYEGVKASVEVSVAESRAWVLEGSFMTTPIELGSDVSARRKLSEGKAGSCLANGACLYSRIELGSDVSARRKLAEGKTGSCLANGACLYSRDEILTLSAESRALLESYFTAEAAIKTYEVEVDGGDELLEFIRGQETPMYGEGFTTDDYGFEQMVRIAWSSDFKGLSYTNASDDAMILQDRNGTYTFDADGVLTWCDLADSTMMEVFDAADPFGDASSSTFDMVFLAKGETPPADFLPAVPDLEADCLPIWNAATVMTTGDDDYTDDYADLSEVDGRRLFVGSAEEGGVVHTLGNPSDDTKTIHVDAQGNEIGEVDHIAMLKKNLELNGFFAGESEEHVQEHRKLWSGGSANAKELWEVTQAAYKGAAMPSGWTHWTTCETDNAYARFIYKYPVMTVGIAGTDGLSDFGDWVDNLDTDHKSVNGMTVHEGFYEYQEKIASCINNYRNLLSGWGIDMDYIAGHSLGGAASTVFSKVHGRGTAQLYTFGAPKTRVGASCTESGVRYAHESDSVASNAMGVMNSFSHDISGSIQMYSESYCSSNCWVGCCPWGWSSRKKTRGQGCTQASGGCSFLLDCAYYFATVHTKYGDYL